MIYIRNIKENEVDMVSEFIANMNSEAKHHIGYCGCEKNEILNSLLEDEIEKYCITAFDEDKLIGLLAVDIDEEKREGELWGPFLKEGYEGQGIEDNLWASLMEISKCNTYFLFFDNSNVMCMNFAIDKGFKEKEDYIIMNLKKKEWKESLKIDSFQITKEYHEQFKKLHDENFPNAYYSGDTILKRLNNFRKLFIIKDKDKLLGSIYVEVEPEFAESTIEFFGVREDNRGKGIGRKLITIAIDWIFSFESIEDITLCVRGKNNRAIRLYRKTGFNNQWNMKFFKYHVIL